MGLRFTVLASGSSGNATLLETDGFGLLIDAGLSGRELKGRLTKAGVGWDRVNAMLLTHVHSDHWNDGALSLLSRHRIPFFCHAAHSDELRRLSRVFDSLESESLVRHYENDVEVGVAAGMRCRPIAVRHDSEPTFGFRFEAAPDLFGESLALGYASDLGCWDDVIAEAFANVDLLAVEYNHDVVMQKRSRRPHELVTRVLGNEGHLSNRQAADLLHAVLQRSTPGRLQHVVQLHLSRECNHPSLAIAEARMILEQTDSPAQIHTTSQDRVTPTIRLSAAAHRSPRRASSNGNDRNSSSAAPEPRLPGFGATP